MSQNLESVRKQYRDLITDGMAHMLWLHAFADWVEELDRDERRELGFEISGKDIDDVAPETPKAAHKAADELVKLYEAQNHDIVDLYIFAQTADLESDFELWSETAVDSSWKSSDAFDFGGYLADMALGTGRSWFDDHKQFELKKPFFECHFDGDELYWSGGTHDVREVSGKIGNLIVVNHDSQPFTDHSYVLRFGGFTEAGATYLLIYADSLGDALDEFIDWIREERPDSLADEQVTEQYNENIAAGMSEHDAISDAESDTTQGGNYGNYIHSEDWSLVAEDPSEESLQKIGKRDNPACKPEYHDELKHDPKKWEKLEDLGTQKTKRGTLELRNCPECHSTLSIFTSTKQNPGNRRVETGDAVIVRDGGRTYPATIVSARLHRRGDDPSMDTFTVQDAYGVITTGIERRQLSSRNPAGLTAKGERMYEDIKRSYQKKGDPRAKEIASRTVLKQSHKVPGLVKNSAGNDEVLVRKYGLDYFLINGIWSVNRVRDALVDAGREASQSSIRAVIRTAARMRREAGLEPAIGARPRKRNPSREKAARMRAEKVLERRRRAEFEPACDDPNCRGWDLFETQHGYGIQACDMCNDAAEKEGLPVLHDSDAKELADARRAMARAVRGA